MSVNFSRFNANTLISLANLAINVPPYPGSCYNRPSPRSLAEKYGRPVLTREPLDGIIELQNYHLILGIEANPTNVPYEIRYLTHRPITINAQSLMFKTPIYGRSLAQTPINVIPGGDSNLLVVTLPQSLIEECGDWWYVVNSDEEYEIIPEVLKIKYNSVNVLNTILNKRY